jgi:hypothetical protein
VPLHPHDLGLTWVQDERMERASHALAHDGRVWFVDPVDEPEAIERALALGRPAAVLQLLDRHDRDGQALAERLGVPRLRLPDAVPDSPFKIGSIIDRPRWRERGLWWPARRALVVPEAVGTARYFAVGPGRVGVHPFLRLRPPGVALGGRAPEHLLVGHGPPVHGPDTARALDEALRRSVRDIPALLKTVPLLRRSAS